MSAKISPSVGEGPYIVLHMLRNVVGQRYQHVVGMDRLRGLLLVRWRWT